MRIAGGAAARPGRPEVAAVVLAPVLTVCPVARFTWLVQASRGGDRLGRARRPGRRRARHGRARIRNPTARCRRFCFPQRRACRAHARHSTRHGPDLRDPDPLPAGPAGPGGLGAGSPPGPWVLGSSPAQEPLSQSGSGCAVHANQRMPEIARELSVSVHTVRRTCATCSPSSRAWSHRGGRAARALGLPRHPHPAARLSLTEHGRYARRPR
jgi:hypothetical protein